MTSRFRLGLLVSTIFLIGCDQSKYAGPILYRDHERMAKELAEKPKLQATIRKILVGLYGPDLRHMKVPEDSGLRYGGMFLANQMWVGEKLVPVVERNPTTAQSRKVDGGYALYRKHCLHCHGVAGAGDGPTSDYLFPRPRDYRPGIFKFTSTNPVNAKPSRADLTKTILYGLHGTSMPGFEAIMGSSEIDQVIDYMTFLSIRGETERYLIDEAASANESDAETAFPDDLVKELVSKVTTSWSEAETSVVKPASRRVESTRESVARGRDYFLGTNTTGPKLECVSCHGSSGKGNGGAFIEPEIFKDVVFRQWPLDQAIDRYYWVAKEKLAVSHHEADSRPVAPDVEALTKFLVENPPFVTHLRKHRGLMTELPDKDFTEKLKSDPASVTQASRKLLPDLNDPEFRTYLIAKMDLWSKSLDVWENPLRPANLIDGTYKGGRRPLDLYWRLAKGINGAKMPAHAGLLSDDQIWDVVNFILALPEDPGLLPDSSPAPARPTPVAASH